VEKPANDGGSRWRRQEIEEARDGGGKRWRRQEIEREQYEEKGKVRRRIQQTES
jgi:hypothetical protein